MARGGPVVRLLFVFLFFAGTVSGACLKGDEELYFSPTYGYKKNGQWIVHLHGWVYEPEPRSIWRKASIKILKLALNITHEEASAILSERLSPFLVDNERRKAFDITLSTEVVWLPPSRPDGHIHDTLKISASVAAGWHQFSAHTCDPAKEAMGKYALLDEKGVSVISDIDDTVKLTDVLDRRSLLANTFLRKFSAVPGMAELYGRWEKNQAAFHYVSGSPWPIAAHLDVFLEEHSFPDGSLHLRHFRTRLKDLYHLRRPPDSFKRETIAEIIGHFPKRTFILVGDSGEMDPEVYGAMARQFPGQIEHIYIRQVSPAHFGENRAEKAFSGVPKDRWTVFDSPAKIGKRS